MSGAVYSTYDIRVRAVHAVVYERLPVTVVAQAYGTVPSTVHRWLSRYQEGGDSRLQRKPVSGRPRKLQRVDKDTLKSIVLAGAGSQIGSCRKRRRLLCSNRLGWRWLDVGVGVQFAGSVRRAPSPIQATVTRHRATDPF
jgi:transposase-like protein